MFTGLVQAVGQLVTRQSQEEGAHIQIHVPNNFMKGVHTGDSICVQGVCLTVTELDDSGFHADVSPETLRSTTFGSLRVPGAINLEKSLTMASPLGGHLVSGHVDGIATVCEQQVQGEASCFTLRTEDALARYIARKGSVCLDGVSLTVNGVDGPRFEVMIIPHTMAQTTIREWRPDQQVNIEVDLLARYAERILQYERKDQDL